MRLRNSNVDQNDGLTPATSPRLRALLYDADGKDCELDAAQVDAASLSEHQLLWVDLCGETESVLADMVGQIGLGKHTDAVRAGLQGGPRVENFGEWFLIRADAIVAAGGACSDDAPPDRKLHKNPHAGELRYSAQELTIVTGHNFVLTVHGEPLPFLEELRQREQSETQLGVLSAERFTASLLDWQLATYFDAVSDFETAVDRLEVNLLSGRKQRDCLPELARLRQVVSRLRRRLAPHRNLFAALERPDFRPTPDDSPADSHFHLLGERFDHAMDAVENARDLVVGSFELFATRAAQRTNDTIRVLTVITAVLGTLAVIAGVLGMNFSASLFETGGAGFWIVVLGMAVLSAAAFAVAKWRDWL